ncbi:MAG: hypothetical protein IKH90_05150 [Ruminococcus sp.]|nr:hypothetical protein [Ruminococcus sp.]
MRISKSNLMQCRYREGMALRVPAASFGEVRLTAGEQQRRKAQYSPSQVCVKD